MALPATADLHGYDCRCRHWLLDRTQEAHDPDDPDGKRGKSPAMGGAVNVEKDEPGRYTDYKPIRIPTETPKLPEPFESLETTWEY